MPAPAQLFPAGRSGTFLTVRFRKEHRHVWPTSFSGGYASDDPTGRAFREDGSGMFYLIGSDGRLVAKTSAIDELELHLSKLVTTGPSIRSER